MSKTLIEFYKDIISSIGLNTTDDGYIFAGSSEDRQLINHNGKMMVIPTKDHIDTMFTQNEDGKIVVGKVLFNPLREDELKGNSTSFNKAKYFIETKLGHSMYVAGELLLTLANKPDLQKKSSFEINKFLSKLNEANNTGIKELVDEKSISNWANIYKKILNSDNGVVTIFSKKMGKIGSDTFNRTAVLRCDLYTELLTANNTIPVFDVKLRNKELIILKNMLEFLLPGIEEKPHTITVGSNDPESPAFISLMCLYIRIVTRLNKIITDLKKVDQELYESGYTNLSVTEEEISNSSIYKADVVLIPNEVDSNRQIRQHENSLTGAVNGPHNITNTTLPNSGNTNISGVPLNAPLPQANTNPLADMDPVDRLLCETGYTPISIKSEQPVVVPPNFNQMGGGYMVQPIQRPPLQGINMNTMTMGMQQPMPQYPMINPAMQTYSQGMMTNPVMGNYNNPYQPQVPYRPSLPPIRGIRRY